MPKEKIFLVFVFCVAGFIYWPGLSGPFLLDDANLRVIAEIGGVDTLRDLWRYLASDPSGIIGRPISNLTFLANYHTWPADPLPFKATNLAIHLLVGGLIYWLVSSLLVQKQSPSHTGRLAACFITAFWLLNPFNVSTTLYVIQRSAMLSALFVIAGLIFYVHGRKRLAENNLRGHIWMTAAILVGTPLAVLCKENGALLPLLVLVLEYTVIRHHLRLPAPRRAWTVAFLWLPSLLVFLSLLYFSTPQAYAGRNFTLTERLLTEGRVLLEYLYYWFNPFAVSRGVLAGDYPVSTGLLSPWTTLPALLIVLGSITWAIRQRRRYPLLALAILFYFAGHLMESTMVPLEIYFEHRNYLPTIFLIMPLAFWVIGEKKFLYLFMTVVLSLQAIQTFRLAEIWGNELTLAAWWSYNNPDATRAQDFYATTLSEAGRSDLALQVLEQAIQRNPDNSHYYLHALFEECGFKQVASDRLHQLANQFARFPLDKKSYPLLEKIITIVSANQCRGVSISDLLNLIDILARHPNSRKDTLGYAQLMHVRGLVLLLDGHPRKAVESFKESLKFSPDIRTGLEQVALLGTHHYYKLGLSWLDYVSHLPRPTSLRGTGQSWDIDTEIEHLRTQLEKDYKKSTSPGPDS